MADNSRAMVIDARVNSLAGAHGIARSVIKLAAHLPPGDDGLALRVLVNAGRPQLFPLAQLPAHADVISTDIPLFAAHRSWSLARLLRAAGAAVLWVPHPLFTPVIRPCPLVVTLHDCILETDAAFAGGWHRQAGQRLATALALRRAAATTAPSWASVAEIRHHYPSAPRLTMVPNGIEPGPFSAVEGTAVAAARQRYRLPAQFVLAVGARRPHKNHEILIRALDALPAQVSLVIAGYPDPAFRDPLPGLISALGLASRVVLLPEVDETLLPAVYRAASAFACPSLVEGYGLPVLEAMAAGVPVVASDIPALAEVAGSAAVLVPPGDAAAWAAALRAVLAGPPASAARAAAAAAAVSGAGWERGAAVLHALLAAVAAGRGPGPAAPGPAAGGTGTRAALGNRAAGRRRRGAHQLNDPSSRIIAGSSSARMRVASRIRATLMPAPSSLSRPTLDVPRAMKTMASSPAAVVTIPPVRSRPIATAAVVSRPRACSSAMRLRRKTW